MLVVPLKAMIDNRLQLGTLNLLSPPAIAIVDFTALDQIVLSLILGCDNRLLEHAKIFAVYLEACLVPTDAAGVQLEQVARNYLRINLIELIYRFL